MKAAAVVRRWSSVSGDAAVLVDSAGEGIAVEHKKIDPPVEGLESIDSELKALEVVRAAIWGQVRAARSMNATA